MKSVMIIITPKKARRFLLVSLLVLCPVIPLCLFVHYTSLTLPTLFSLESVQESELSRENDRLLGALESILPAESMVRHENEFRGVMGWNPGHKTYDFKTYPLQEVVSKGIELPFKVVLDEPSYVRPLYDPQWKGAYFRGWLDLTFKNIDARHRLFIYPLGLSAAFDFEGALGFSEQVAADAHRNINFLVYNYKVQGIKRYQNQIILSGEPTRSGMQFISMVQDQALPDKVNTQDFLFQLSTPKGYEMDYVYGTILRYDFLMKIIQENTAMVSANSDPQGVPFEELLKKNRQLKKELQYYIPLEDKVITAAGCRPLPAELAAGNTDIKTAMQKGNSPTFTTVYQDKQYRRPVYHPDWKANYQKKWAYLPEQICLNLHRLFAVPGDVQARTDLFGKLGFKESPESVIGEQPAFLVYNYTITKAVVYNSQILLSGEPSRSGAQLITIPKSALNSSKDYLVRLVTPDSMEADYDIVKHK